jgi:hypothetical protein
VNARAPLNVIALNDCWENVHPDVIHVPEGFGSYQYWMIFTPYPLMSDRFENPTVRASHDGTHWQRVPGTPEPLVPSPPVAELHHADPELVCSSGTLYAIYLTIHRRTREVTFNSMSCTSDLRWSKPEVIHEDVEAVSPTFQVEDNVWHEWFIRASKEENLTLTRLVHREGPDLSSLGNERLCDLTIPKHVPWHIDVLRVEEGYEALIAAYPKGSDNGRTRLFHAVSRDGFSFELSRNAPLLKPSRLGWDNRMIYRSSFLKESDGTYRVWYSAASWTRHCGIGLLRGPLDSLTESASELAQVPSPVARIPGEVVARLRYEMVHQLSRFS